MRHIPKRATPEQGHEALRAAIAAGAHYRRDYQDAILWEKLARERGIRLPAWWVAPTPSALRRWLKKTRPGEVFADIYGYKTTGRPMTPADLIARNPDMPLRAFVGQMLEG
jgi:hypothetical protein